MAFVYQQPRKFNHQLESSSQLGPGKYCLEDVFEKKEEHYAPFLSTSIRRQKKSTFITPGPGAYSMKSSSKANNDWEEDNEILKTSKIKKPEHGFLSTMSRFKVKDQIIPGPGSYQQFKTCSLRSPLSSKSHRTLDILRSNLNKTKSLRVPTIPVNQNKNGYTLNEKNQLIIIQPGKQKIIPLDHTLTRQYHPKTNHTPINYNNVASRIIQCTKEIVYRQFIENKSKQIKQSLTTTLHKPLKRKLRSNSKENDYPILPKTVLPGPGSYQPTIPSSKLRTLQKFQFFGSSSLRFKDQNKQNQFQLPAKRIFQRTTDFNENKKYKQSFSKGSRGLNNLNKEASPGPGKYISSKFKFNQRKIVTSTEPRFHSSKALSQTTQATFYQTQKSIIKQKIRPQIIKHYPPQKKIKSSKDLGPASYDISVTDIANEVMKRRSNAPFGSKNNRFMNLKKDNFDIGYLQPQSSFKQKNVNPFNTTTRRFDYKNIQSVGPGAYDSKVSLVKESFNVKFIKVE